MYHKITMYNTNNTALKVCIFYTSFYVYNFYLSKKNLAHVHRHFTLLSTRMGIFKIVFTSFSQSFDLIIRLFLVVVVRILLFCFCFFNHSCNLEFYYLINIFFIFYSNILICKWLLVFFSYVGYYGGNRTKQVMVMVIQQSLFIWKRLIRK